MTLQDETGNNKLKFAQSVILGSIVVALLIPALTILAELMAPFKDWLKNNFNHHWIGKGVISVIVFVGIYALGFVVPYKPSLERINRSIFILITLVLIGVLVIFGLFSYEAFLQ